VSLAGAARNWKDDDALRKEVERRRKEFGPADGLRALSTLVEREIGDRAVAAEVGYTALEWGLHGQAYHVFRHIAEAVPEEPHAYLAMAACLTALGKTDLALLCCEVALACESSGDFRRIAIFEYLRLLRTIDSGGLIDFVGKRRRELEKEIGLGQADLVVLIEWNTTRTDVDLHVTDPDGEECYYSNRKTKIGGWMTGDVKAGFGPEMFVLKKAVPGEYLVRVKYYASDSSRLSTRTAVRATVYENWGRPTERVIRKTVALAQSSDMREIVRLAR
jgi:hypothetical protein